MEDYLQFIPDSLPWCLFSPACILHKPESLGHPELWTLLTGVGLFFVVLVVLLVFSGTFPAGLFAAIIFMRSVKLTLSANERRAISEKIRTLTCQED